MKALLLKGPKEAALVDVPVPEISDSEVLVEVKYCGICGSDLEAYRHAELMHPGTFMGHEFAGVIAKVGSMVNGWKPGNRVVVLAPYQCGECWACKHGFASCCQRGLEQALGCTVGEEWAGGFAQFVRIPTPEKRLFTLPDSIPFEEAALIDPLACSLHVVRLSNFKPGDYTMVLGAGVIGLGVIALLKNAGAGLIIATETIEKRAELASKFGADYVFNPREVSDLKEEVLKLTNGLGVNQVFECSGSPRAFQSATSFLRPRGQVMLYGALMGEVLSVPSEFIFGEYQLQGGLWVNDEFPMVIEYLRKGALPVKDMITSKIRLSDVIEQGFDKLLDPKSGEIKILVYPE